MMEQDWHWKQIASAENRMLVYKSRLKWLFIAGFLCGTVIGTAIVEIWIRL